MRLLQIEWWNLSPSLPSLVAVYDYRGLSRGNERSSTCAGFFLRITCSLAGCSLSDSRAGQTGLVISKSEPICTKVCSNRLTNLVVIDSFVNFYEIMRV